MLQYVSAKNEEIILYRTTILFKFQIIGDHIQICLDLTSCCGNTEKFHKKGFRICKIIKYRFTTWANALIVTSLKRQSLGLQTIIKQYQDYI